MLRKLGKSALIAVGFGLLAVPGLQAQQGPPAQQQQSVELSDAEMERFVRMYVAVDSIRQQRKAELRTVQDEEKAKEIQKRGSDKMLAKLTEHGYTPKDYTRILKAINADRKLLDRFEAKREELIDNEDKKKDVG